MKPKQTFDKEKAVTFNKKHLLKISTYTENNIIVQNNDLLP